MKSVDICNQMDLDDEWEVLLSDDDDDGRKYDEESSTLEMNYFICPPKPHHDDEGKKVPVEIKMEDQHQVLFNKTEFVDMNSEEKGEFESSSSSSQARDNVWKRGIGAICSFGVATLCIILFTHRHPPNQSLIYTTHKASRLNEYAMGVPISRARITCGGYYDAATATASL